MNSVYAIWEIGLFQAIWSMTCFLGGKSDIIINEVWANEPDYSAQV